MSEPLEAETAPFFDEPHRALGRELDALLADAALEGLDDAAEVARRLGPLYRHAVPEGASARLDLRALCLVRERLGYVSPLADSVLAVQGLGAHPLVLAGAAPSLVARAARGEALFAFALTEPEAGSDVAALRTAARRDGDGWVLDGEKTFISNAGLATHYLVFANADPAAGRRGITAFLVERERRGLSIEPITLSAPHPIGRLVLRGCRVPAPALVGELGGGFRLAMATLDTFRVSVGAAACGMARRALDAALAHVRARRQFGVALAEQPAVQAYLAEMATDLDAARLLVLRAAHRKDTAPPGTRATREAAMAKLHATEAAFRIVDRAVQLHGGAGVIAGAVVERLAREVRPLRIYEGTSEIQRLVIARELLGR
jgi:acyl-CoA dehydrogenase